MEDIFGVAGVDENGTYLLPHSSVTEDFFHPERRYLLTG